MNTSITTRTPLAVEDGVWIVVVGELSIFTLFFTTYLYYRAFSPELYETSQATLNIGIGALNTLILLASSFSVASATRVLQISNNYKSAFRLLVAALLCGAAFVILKVFEYGSAFEAGVNVLTNEFFMFYFMLTGIHLMHLLVGMTLLAAMALQLRIVLRGKGEISQTFGGFATSFWHMLDIVWIVLFPLLYLLP